MKWILLFQLMAFTSLAKDKPIWTTTSVQSDTEYKFYIGRASAVAGESNAVSLATKDAYEQAHRENFGSEVQINSETYQTNTSAQSIARISEKSKTARFEGFEQKDIFVEDAGGGRFNAWVLYKFLKSSISKEQQRLKSLPEHDLALPVFSVQGSSKDSVKGVLQITTDPQGAVVFVDGERFGKTPLQLNGQLEIGSHKLRLDHPQYETFEEELIIGANKTTTVERTLVRSSGLLQVNVDVPNASVMINAQPVGVTPIKDPIRVEAGVPHKIEITHAETEKYSQEVTVNKGDSRLIEIILPKKPSYLSFDTTPSGATVKINDKEMKTPVEKIQLKSGSYKVEVSKADFLTRTFDLDLLGGENKTLPMIDLTPVSVEQKRLATSPYKIAFGLGFIGSSIKDGKSQMSYSFGFEKKFFNLIGVRFIYDYASGGSKDRPEGVPTNGTANSSAVLIDEQTSKIMAASLPIYFYDSFYISPEIGTAKVELQLRTLNYNSSGVLNRTDITSTEFSQPFTGGYLGCEWLSENKSSSWNLEIGLRNFGSVSGYESSSPVMLKGLYTINF